MPTALPPGKQPVRPVRAPNSGSANGGRAPGRPPSEPPAPKSDAPNKNSNMAKSALKFAFMPEIGRSLQGVKFAWDLLVNLVAQIYVMVKLIPEDHPCANLRNAGEYKLKDIISIAFKSLKWQRDQIPQIVIFFAVLLFLFFIALSLITLILSVGVNAAHADTTAGNSANDVLNSIFNLQGTGMIPTAFGAMLRAYSNIVLVLAGIILLYLIMQYIVESARHGQPGGKSFNHAWAPVRLVFALGLLVPLSSGMNSGQYITLYLAKWGSDMASNVYKQFAISLQNGQGVTVNQVTVQPQKALEKLFNLEACLAAYNVKNPGSPLPSPTMVDDPNNANSKIMDFSGTTMGNATGCGKIHFYYNATATEPNELLLNEQYKFFLAYLPQIQTLAQDYISHTDPQSANYFQAIQTSDYSSQITTLSNTYRDTINTAAQTAATSTNTELGQEMQASINSLGWVTAPTWLERVATQNSAVADAQSALPDITNNSQDYASEATGKSNTANITANSTPEEIEAWKTDTTAKATNIGQRIISNVFSGWPQLGPALYKSLIMDSPNPYCSLVTFGHVLFRFAEAAYAGWIQIVTMLGLSATSNLGMQINVGMAYIQAFTPMVTAFIGMAFMTGMMLGFMLSLIPTIRFVFAVLGWIIMVFVAVMGMPLFALAHLKTGGEGWMGQLQVASAYNLLIGIIIRPTLIILGFIASLIVFNTIVKLAGTLLYMSAATDNTGLNAYLNVVDSFDPLAQLIKIFIFSTFVQALANACFKLVDIVPSQAMTWMGTGPMSSAVEGGGDEATSLAQNLGGQMSSAFHGRLQNKASETMENARLLRQDKNTIKAAAKAADDAKKNEPSGIGKTGDAAKQIAAVTPGGGSGENAGGGGKGASVSQGSKASANLPNIDIGANKPAQPAIANNGAGANGGHSNGQQSSPSSASPSSATPPAPSSGSPGAGDAGGDTPDSTANTDAAGSSAAAAGGSNQQAAQTTSGEPGGKGTDDQSAEGGDAKKPSLSDGLGSYLKATHPLKAENVKNYTQNQARGWGMALGLASAFIPGGSFMVNRLSKRYEKQTKSASTQIFKEAEAAKAALAATGGGTGMDEDSSRERTASGSTPNVNDESSFLPGGALYNQQHLKPSWMK